MAVKDWNGFKGAAKQIEDKDIGRIAHMIGCGEDPVRAFMDVEANGDGFDKLGRPKMLRETYKFYLALGPGPKRDKAMAAGLATTHWVKNYPKDSYPDLVKMMAIDETAALMSCSWGFEQLMGGNYRMGGYDSVQEMVKAHMADEENHLVAMVNFIKHAGIDDDLRRLDKMKHVTPNDCRVVVRVYNGSGYEKNDYHTKFATRLNHWKGVGDTKWDDDPVVVDQDLPAEAKEAVENLYDGKFHDVIQNAQLKLDALGYPEVGTVDGKWGRKTQTAVLAFKAEHNMPLTVEMDKDFLAALMIAAPREIDTARKTTTVADLRAEGAEDVKTADGVQTAGAAVGGVGLLTGAAKLVDLGEGYGGLLKRVADTVEPIQGFVQENFWLLAIGIGGFVAWKSGVLKNIRLLKHQNGQDVSR